MVTKATAAAVQANSQNNSTGQDGVLAVESSFDRRIQLSSWPASCAHPEATNIVSVVCGNSRLHWSIHEGFESEFTSSIFWKTTALAEADVAPSKKTDSAKTLTKYFPKNAYPTLGGPNFTEKNLTLSNLYSYITQKRIPFFHIYVVTTNPEASDRIPGLFEQVPCCIHQLKATDFFEGNEHALYSGVGVDRCATLYAARELYGAAVLVIDGGTALTYTATDSKGQLMGGGGITLGLGIKCRSLNENTGALPYLNNDFVKDRIEQCEAKKEPLPIFGSRNTEDAILVGILREFADTLCSTIEEWVAHIHKEWEEEANDTKVVEEAADSQAGGNEKSKERRTLTVVVTGGDAPILEKLLHPQYSYVLPPNERHAQVMSKVTVVSIKNMSTHGISLMLKKRAVPYDHMSKVEQVRHDLLGSRVVQPKAAVTGRRKAPPQLRGTVVDLKRDLSTSLSRDAFKVKYDNGDTAIMGPFELFDCLMEYHKVGEDVSVTARDTADEAENRTLQKNRARSAAVALSSLVMDLQFKYQKMQMEEEEETRQQAAEQQQPQRQLPAVVEPDTEPPPAKRPLETAEEDGSASKVQKQSGNSRHSMDQLKEIALGRSPAARKAAAVPDSKPAAHSTPDSGTKVITSPSSTTKATGETSTAAEAGPSKAKPESSSKKFQITAAEIKRDSTSYVSRRVAKKFDGAVYFGTIGAYTPPAENEDEDAALWHVEYDDGDEEDYDVHEMVKYLKLYASKQHEDPQKQV
ncbi:hypothetical protein ACA910_018017 [Epithemia clementina (nom. ined.)]